MLQKAQNHLERYKQSWRQSGNHIHALIIVAVVAFVGLIGVYGIKAATYVAKSEAEVGVISGNAATATNATASGGSVVMFGGAISSPTTPSGLKTFTGGTSIALRWDEATAVSSIKQYNIFRNGSQVATVTPGFHADFPEKDGNGYIDTNVTRGTTYSYQVQAVGTTNATSALSTSVSATHPTTTTAVPTINVDTSTAPDLAAYMASAKAFLQIWYPKMSDLLARPDYTPPSTITIIAQQGYNGLAGTANSTTTISADYARQNPHDLGVWIHESTHILQSYPTNPIGWATEGIADWTREYPLHDRDPQPPRPGDSYTQGYAQASYFLNWIQSTYSPNFIHKLNVTLHNNTYTSNFFPDNTGGKTIDQLWAELTSKSYSSPGQVTGIGGKCIDIANGAQAVTTKTQLLTCNGLDQQKWTAWYADASQNRSGIFYLRAYSVYCLDIKNAGTTNGTITWIYGCSDNIAQQWKVGPNSSLINPNSGKCLDTTGGTSEDGNQLIINTCNGSASQRWTIPN